MSIFTSRWNPYGWYHRHPEGFYKWKYYWKTDKGSPSEKPKMKKGKNKSYLMVNITWEKSSLIVNCNSYRDEKKEIMVQRKVRRYIFCLVSPRWYPLCLHTPRVTGVRDQGTLGGILYVRTIFHPFWNQIQRRSSTVSSSDVGRHLGLGETNLCGWTRSTPTLQVRSSFPLKKFFQVYPFINLL